MKVNYTNGLWIGWATDNMEWWQMDLTPNSCQSLVASLRASWPIVGGIRWCSAWPYCSSPWHWLLSLWREGAHYPGTQGQSDNRVTTVYLPRQRGHNSLPDIAYLLTARWTGAWEYQKKRPNFSTLPGDRTQDLSIVSRARYRYTTESPLLFIIYINDLDVGINNLISKFADDTKIRNSVLTEEDRQSFQEDLHKISAWSNRYEMPRSHLKARTRNKKFNCEMHGVKMKSIPCMKDLGVKIM